MHECCTQTKIYSILMRCHEQSKTISLSLVKMFLNFIRNPNHSTLEKSLSCTLCILFFLFFFDCWEGSGGTWKAMTSRHIHLPVPHLWHAGCTPVARRLHTGCRSSPLASTKPRSRDALFSSASWSARCPYPSRRVDSATLGNGHACACKVRRKLCMNCATFVQRK